MFDCSGTHGTTMQIYKLYLSLPILFLGVSYRENVQNGCTVTTFLAIILAIAVLYFISEIQIFAYNALGTVLGC